MLAVKEPRRTKSENLSLRLDPKNRFALEFAARVEKRNISTIVELAIRAYAGKVGVSWEGADEEATWQDFWDASEGVRILKMLADSRIPTTYEEDELRAFTVAHRAFFYADKNDRQPRRGYLEILWPRINEFLETWRREKAVNYWAAGEQMKKAISDAGVAAPEWPPSASPTTNWGGFGSKAGDLDDDIPF